MAEYLWFLLLEGKRVGPFTVKELKGIAALTPDTLAWREGMSEWRQVRDIPELKELFKDEEPYEIPEEAVVEGGETANLILDAPRIEPPLLFWLILLTLIVIYAVLQINS